jgi:hypothetical protein
MQKNVSWLEIPMDNLVLPKMLGSFADLLDNPLNFLYFQCPLFEQHLEIVPIAVLEDHEDVLGCLYCLNKFKAIF